MKTLLALLSLLLMSSAWGEPVRARSLEEIQASGQLRVGVKADVMPWGFRERPDGPIIGMEPDLAARVANRIGVELKLVAVESNERVDALNRGRIDLLMATFSDTPERRAQVTMVYPSYFASGVNLLSRKEDGFREWSQLRNRRVCGRRGSFYNRPLTLRYGMDVIAFHSLIWAKDAVRDGRCSALLYDDIAIIADLRDPEWSKEFEMAMPSLFQAPWSIALPRSDKAAALQALVSDLIIQWHREGVITALERTWEIPVTKFTRHMQQVWSRRRTDGTWFCGEHWAPGLPQDCAGPREGMTTR